MTFLPCKLTLLFPSPSLKTYLRPTPPFFGLQASKSKSWAHMYLDRLVSRRARDIDEEFVTSALGRIVAYRSSFGNKIIPHIQIEPPVSQLHLHDFGR
jgi:hypothetical protein